MAHFAKLNDDNLVIDVNVVDNNCLNAENEEQSGIDFLIDWSGGYSNWKQTSYNGKIRKHYAGIGFSYDPNLDVFIPPKCHESAMLDEENVIWICTEIHGEMDPEIV